MQHAYVNVFNFKDILKLAFLQNSKLINKNRDVFAVLTQHLSQHHNYS